MASILNVSNFTGLTESAASTTGSNLDTGDLRRAYNTLDAWKIISSIQVKRDVFFRALSVFSKGTVTDTNFKFAEERPSFNRRYGYITAHGTDSSCSNTGDATLTASEVAAGAVYYWKMGTDYKSAGNIMSRYGQSSGEVTIGDAGTKPEFFLVGDKIKINTGTAFNSGPLDYIEAKIQEITDVSTTHVILKTEITRTMLDTTNNLELQWKSATAPMDETYNVNTANTKTTALESKRTYVVGSAFAPGSGVPETWRDQPYSTGEGKTEIFKTSLGMDGSTMATELKFTPNEWVRLWGNKLMDHKRDISTSLYFSSLRTDSDGARHTQGMIDYVLRYGQVFSLTLTSKTIDDFLEDLSEFADVTKGVSLDNMLFLMDKPTYNWMNKWSGFHANSLEISTNFRADFMTLGKNKLLARKANIEANTISTLYGDMNIAHDPHLTGSPVKIVGVNMKNAKYVVLNGNNINRDTKIYLGVQRIETTGVDSRKDLIQTESGMQQTLPETHVVWK